MQSESITEKSLGVSVLIGFIFSLTLNLVTRYNDSIHLFNLKEEQSIGVITTFIFFSGLVFLFSDNGRNRLKLISLSALFGLILGIISIDLFRISSFLSIVTLTLGTYAAFCMIQSYHESHYSRPSYTILFASVWNNVSLSFLSSVFLLLVYFLIGLCFYIFYTFSLHPLTAIIKNLYFNLTVIPLSLCIGFYFTSRWKTLVFSTRMILLEFFKILLPVFNIITWFFLILIPLTLLFKVFNVSLGPINSLSLHLAFYSIIIINAIYMDGSNLNRLSSFYRRSMIALCLALPCLLLSSIVITVYTANPLLNQESVPLLTLIVLGILYSIAYIVGIRQPQHQWMSYLKTANFRLSWVLMALGILLNIPYLMGSLPAAPQDERIYRPIKKINSTQLAQAKIKKIQLDFKRSHLKWVNSQSTSSPVVVLGYRHNQPLTLCQPENNAIPVGVINNGKCLIIEDNKISTPSTYKILSGEAKNIKWVPKYNSIFYFYSEKSKYKYAVCRAIINNRIYLGVKKTSLESDFYDVNACNFIVNGTVIKWNDFKRLQLDLTKSK